LQIIADILMVIRNGAKNGARKTKIMYQANLSYRLLNDYLDYTLETNLISTSPEDKSQYVITPRGYEFLEKYVKYSQRSKQLEEQLQQVTNEKALLERSYVSRSANSGSRNSSSKQNRKVDSSAG